MVGGHAARDELLQRLLMAASIDGETVIQRLGEYLLELAGREFRLQGPVSRKSRTR